MFNLGLKHAIALMKLTGTVCSLFYMATGTCSKVKCGNKQGPVPQKPINANLRLKTNQAFYFSTAKCCSTQIFGRTLHEKTSILKNKNKQKKLSTKSRKRETKVYTNPGLS